jgi:hypothetical protein
MSKLKSLIYNFATPILNKVNRFNNLHNGETCYIFGDGSSIKYFDLNAFNNHVSIVGNYIPFHNEFSQLNAKYCIMSAPFYFSPYFGYDDPDFKNHLYQMSKLYKKFIINNNKLSFFLNLSNFPFAYYDNVYFNFLKYPKAHIPKQFISNEINCFTGVLRHAISLAIFMGFSDIVLVGCDYTHSPSTCLHWYEKGSQEVNNLNNYDKYFFELATKYAKITTVTIDGKSDLLDYISYEKLTGLKPHYKENEELISETYRNVLKTWKGYKIE